MRKLLLVLALLWGLSAQAQGLPTDTQGLACIATANPTAFTAGEGMWAQAVCDLNRRLYVAGAGGAANPFPGADYATSGRQLGQDGALASYTVTGTGPGAPVSTLGYTSGLVALSGTFSLTTTLEGSNDSTDCTQAVNWTPLFGYLPEDNGGTTPATGLTTTSRKRLYRLADALCVRPNTTAYTSGTAVFNFIRRVGPISERGVYIGGIAGGVTVIGSTTLRAAGTNRSASVGTTAANLMASLATRQGWKIKNDCTNSIWINFDGAASAVPGGGNIKVPAGGYLSSEPGFVETGAMSAIAEGSACNVTAREH